ncbi:MAG: ABC transporter ATP-binding protein [Planctomycetaceae bacterium]
MSEILIDLQNASKSFGERMAVRDVSLKIPAGQLFACLGPNGAGKTTIIKLLTGLLRPSAGRVLVAGSDMSHNAAENRQPLSYVPDEPYLYDKLTGREFLEFTRDIYGMPVDATEQRIAELISVLDVSSYVDELSETYSHGMRQRVVFAAALLHCPRVLVVDEPMVGLDPKSVRVVKDLLRRTANEGCTIFMATHTLSVAEELADRIGILNQGRLTHCGTLNELRADLQSEGTALEDLFLQATASAEDTTGDSTPPGLESA